MSTANMTRWAHFHQIPLRPGGGGSHDSALRTSDQADNPPAPIAKALTSPYAWQRLQRFAAVGCQTLSEVAESLSINQAALEAEDDYPGTNRYHVDITQFDVTADRITELLG